MHNVEKCARSSSFISGWLRYHQTSALPSMPSLPTRSDPDTQDLPAGRPLALLTGTWAGRAVLIGTAVRLIALVLSRSIGGNFVLDVMGTAGTLALLLGLAIFIGRLIGLARRRLLWRVRRKLILSYIFV